MTHLTPQADFLQSYLICAAGEPRMQAGAAALRERVFVQEQAVFAGHDRDAIDEIALPLVAIAEDAAGGPRVVGTVRIHEAAPGIWWGSRLAVAPEWRRVGKLGSELIRLAVGTARARGAVEFHAHVQRQNVVLFRRLHWAVEAEVDLHGRPHAHMLASLAHYTPIEDPAAGWRITAPGPVEGGA
ncbi:MULTISPECIES: MSMEG_0567/Sll0786 family nitrogen starvation N-acetyltransferase [Pseudotabrizicola]|uniref:GNAT family N-acetyltransferase n=1 Tax=Pseudotabrizicola alkalilacus TaxID=2305252 RepID=A0A411Z4Q9_9RHOB|nr:MULTISPECIES: MSMEG_0567/Sll0786 family nitrogen starvation N-acetyltransferase [Pseudotabrizicola]MDO9640746.1 GNAT family N-acetyltransferase [Pseudotabrizicola sp.]RGP38037.1 GNAT family N-acetyltransferase [Pseudotabrizicola alkalilacus]